MKEDIAERFEKKPAAALFPMAATNIREGICPTCQEPVGEFRNALSRKEYGISGMCQDCQDSVFGS